MTAPAAQAIGLTPQSNGHEVNERIAGVMDDDAIEVSTWSAPEEFVCRLRRETDRVQARFQFTVQGEPVSKSRARFNRQGPKVRAYTPTASVEAEQVVKWTYRQALGRASTPDERNGFGLACSFYVGKRQRRDADNMIKLVSDALTGVVWKDDSQVTEVSGRLVHGSDEPRTVVEVYLTSDLPDHMRRKCEVCEQEFRTYASWAKKKTCSASCGQKLRDLARERTCQSCGDTYRAHSIDDAKSKFCSVNCKNDYATVPLICCVCEKQYRKGRSYVRTGNQFCSEACRADYWREHRRAGARGTCDRCGGPTSKRTYEFCQACRLDVKREQREAEAS